MRASPAAAPAVTTLLTGLGLESRADVMADAIRKESTAAGGLLTLRQFVAVARALLKHKRCDVAPPTMHTSVPITAAADVIAVIHA